jgi:hypothetical protein
LLVFVGLILGGLVWHYVWPLITWWALAWFRSASGPLSDALIVAGILGLTVDYFLKRELIRDVGAIFIGWALPQEIRDYIRKVSQTSIVRKNFRVHYRLALVGNGEVSVKIRTSVDVFNYSSGRERIAPQWIVDLQDKPNESAIRCEIDRQGTVKSWTADKLNTPKRQERGPDVMKWTLPSLTLNPQDANDPQLKPACKVSWEYELQMPIQYNDFFAFVFPTIGVEVTVDCPPDLEFTCDHDDATVHAPDSSRWVFNRLYMPGQSIRVRWKPKADQPVANTA